ncbi:hypothetical protein A6E03_14070 [Aliivibrio sp. 1S128]|nr:hypothetical protein A6E03_14070 [Aliivibrio sp. 1S128]
MSDGRIIFKQGSSWYVFNKAGSHEFGPVTTLNAAKQYVANGSVPVESHNLSSSYGRRQSKKEFNSYLATEAKNGNPEPLILWVVILCVVCLVVVVVRGY